VRRVQQLQNERWIKRDEKGHLTPANVVHGYLDFRAAQEARLNARGEEEALLRRLKAKQIENRIAGEEKNLIVREDAEEFATFVVGGTFDRLETMPDRLGQKVIERKRLADLIKQLRAETDADMKKHIGILRTGKDEPDGADD
jgi:hypothetical protein